MHSTAVAMRRVAEFHVYTEDAAGSFVVVGCRSVKDEGVVKGQGESVGVGEAVVVVVSVSMMGTMTSIYTSRLPLCRFVVCRRRCMGSAVGRRAHGKRRWTDSDDEVAHWTRYAGGLWMKECKRRGVVVSQQDSKHQQDTSALLPLCLSPFSLLSSSLSTQRRCHLSERRAGDRGRHPSKAGWRRGRCCCCRDGDAQSGRGWGGWLYVVE